MSQTIAAEDRQLADGLAAWLEAREGLVDGEVVALHRPSAGYSSETVLAEVRGGHGDAEEVRWIVVRMAPRSPGTFEHHDLEAECEAQLAAATSGVPVADPVYERDPAWLGAPFIAMRRIEGHIVGQVPHLDRWVRSLATGLRGSLVTAIVDALARIHRAPVDALTAVPRRDNGSELDAWDAYLRWACPDRPPLVLGEGLAWCRRHRPAREPDPVLLWGDVRLENAVFGDDLALRAVLDWDLCSVGAPEHDLAWLTSLDATMAALFGTRTDGFPSLEAVVARYEEVSGHAVVDLWWYETLAMVKSSAIMTRLDVLRRDAGEAVLLPVEDNPVLDLLRDRIAASPA